jgi:hypothetical protein
MTLFRSQFALLFAVGLTALTGCGTTRSTDTIRTATEQLLISDAIDRAVQSMNLQTLAGQSVYLDDSKLTDTVDRNYYISTLRQQLLASGCELRDKRDDAEFVVEARAGAIGTDRNDLLFGIPSMNVPQIPLVQPAPAAIPEIPIAKRRDQRGIAKIAVFAYHRATGTPVWQSGIVRQESSANDVWIFGTGPFQRGTIYDGPAFAGKAIKAEGKGSESLRRLPAVSVSQENTFTPPQQLAKKDTAKDESKVALAVHQEPVVASTPNTMQPATPPIAGFPMPFGNAAAPIAGVPQPTPPAPFSVPAPLPGPNTVTNSNPPVAPAPASTKPAEPLPANPAIARMGDGAALPQPRFNSPK